MLNKSTRKIKLVKNTFTSLIYEVAVFICWFSIARLILTNYGSAVNGLISSITGFLGFVSVFDLGISAVVKANLYKPLASNDIPQMSRIFVSCRRFYRLIALVLFFYTFILMLFYPNTVNDSFNFLYVAPLVLIISVNSFANYFLGFPYILLLNADQKGYIVSTINTVALVSSTIACVMLINYGFSIHIVKLTTMLIFLVKPIALSIYVRRRYALRFDVIIDVEPIKQKWNGVAQHFASLVQDKTDVIILTVFTSLQNVSVYNIYYVIASGILSLVYTSSSGMAALFGNMLSNNEITKLKSTFEKYEWMMHTTSTLLFSITVVLITPFVKVYTYGVDDANYIVPSFSILLCFALATRCYQLPYNTVVQAANHFKETQIGAIIEPIINITVSIILVNRYGLIGVAIGTLVSLVFRMVYLAVYLFKHIIHISRRRFIEQIFVDILTMGVIMLSTRWLRLADISYYAWIVIACKVCLIALISSCIINVLFCRRLLVAAIDTFLRRK